MTRILVKNNSIWDFTVTHRNQIDKLRPMILHKRRIHSDPINIGWQCIGWVFVVSWHFIVKCVINICFHYCISLVYIDCKYVNYLPSPVKILRCNIYLAKFVSRHLCYIFLNPSSNVFAWTYQIPKTTFQYPQPSLSKNFFYHFLFIFCDAPIFYSHGTPKNGY